MLALIKMDGLVPPPVAFSVALVALIILHLVLWVKREEDDGIVVGGEEEQGPRSELHQVRENSGLVFVYGLYDKKNKHFKVECPLYTLVFLSCRSRVDKPAEILKTVHAVQR
jgi:hypothetical protein